MYTVQTLDHDYFEKKLNLVLRDLANYTPEEMARELARLANTADFTATQQEAERFRVEEDLLARVNGEYD